MADIVDVLNNIAEFHGKQEEEAKKKWLDKIDVLEKVAVLFDDNKDPLTAMEVRRAASSLKALSIIKNR